MNRNEKDLLLRQNEFLEVPLIGIYHIIKPAYQIQHSFLSFAGYFTECFWLTANENLFDFYVARFFQFANLDTEISVRQIESISQICEL